MTYPGRERRKHIRHDLVCPVVVVDADGKELFQSRTVNVSDGGMLLRVGKPLGVGEGVHVSVRIPRQTANTFMYEDFFSGAEVVRRQGDGGAGTMAMKFPRPLELSLQA